MPHEPPLNLSREDLYELVWSKPMVELAQDLGYRMWRWPSANPSTAT